MIIEIYIDTEELTNNQSLVIIDEHGRRWDVEDTLNSSPSSSTGGRNQSARSEVVLERWQIRLGEPPEEIPTDLAQVLPRTYKNSIVLYRSLFTFAKLLPAWKLSKKLSKPRSAHSPPRLKYRIRAEPHTWTARKGDPLTLPLYDARDRVTEDFMFDPIDSPAGSLLVQVSYRSSCDFRIADSEALLSSHFMGMDEQFFEPSLGRKGAADQVERDYAVRGGEPGSLPPKKIGPVPRPSQGQAYGSMSSFHQVGPPASSSPLSALRAARDKGSQSPTERQSPNPPSINRSAQGSRSSLRSADGAPSMGRRPSVSFMPFKTPSLSASPLQTEQPTASVPRGSVGKTSALGALTEARNPSTMGPPSSIPSRSSPIGPGQAATSSSSSSPKPAPLARYSSSFGHRKAKLSVSGGSRTEDDNNSSGKTSITSSAAQPGSGILAEGGGLSSGSMPTDDDNISEFLKMLDQKKDLKSFRTPHDKEAVDAHTKRTTAALTKFQRMRDSNAALSESMSSSLLLHRSSSSSSRQLSSVPPMVAGTSVSTSSSPGKPISPHTPHTPAIPSRLSANSIIEYPHRARHRSEEQILHEEEPARERGPRSGNTSRDPNTGGIDIPTSPRRFQPSYRRSSSVAQQPRTLTIDDDPDVFPYGLRSASLGVDDRPQLGLNAIAGFQDGSALALPPAGNVEPSFGRASNPDESSSAPMTRQQSSSLEGREETGSLPRRALTYRPRIGRAGGVGPTSPHGSLSSLADRGNRSGSSDQRGGRYSYTRPSSTFEEDEPLLFAMSDFGAIQQSRRSLEEARGGGDSTASSRRGSKRGARPDVHGRGW